MGASAAVVGWGLAGGVDGCCAASAAEARRARNVAEREMERIRSTPLWKVDFNSLDFVGGNLLIVWFPTLAAKTNTRRGWGTQTLGLKD